MRLKRHRNATDTTPPADRWVTWRADRLLRAGFPHLVAVKLATDRRTDVHALLELVDRGCPPHLAARILAPLDPSGREPDRG